MAVVLKKPEDDAERIAKALGSISDRIQQITLTASPTSSVKITVELFAFTSKADAILAAAYGEPKP